MTNNEKLSYLKYINTLIKNNEILNAKKLLRKIKKSEFENYKYLINYLNAKIDEIYKTEDEFKYSTYAKISIDKHRYEDALSVYYEGLCATKKNIFNYYIGRSLYKMGYQLEALPYLKKYARFGGFKLSNALLLITIICRNHKMYNESNEYIKKCAKINSFNNSEYELTDFDYHR